MKGPNCQANLLTLQDRHGVRWAPPSQVASITPAYPDRWRVVLDNGDVAYALTQPALGSNWTHPKHLHNGKDPAGFPHPPSSSDAPEWDRTYASIVQRRPTFHSNRSTIEQDRHPQGTAYVATRKDGRDDLSVDHFQICDAAYAATHGRDEFALAWGRPERHCTLVGPRICGDHPGVSPCGPSSKGTCPGARERDGGET